MYNLLISIALGALTAGLAMLIGLTMKVDVPVAAAILPAVFAAVVAMFFLARRTNRQVTAAMAPLGDLLQNQKLAEAQQLIGAVRDQYGPWQFLLKGQLNGQLGVLEYMQLKFDEALPLLEQGTFQNAMVQTLIACVHYRRERLDDAWEMFEKASKTSDKDAMIYVVWATLLVRQDQRGKALEVLSKGLEVIPDHQLLRTMKNTIANKQRIDTQKFPETWYQYFPEDAARMMRMRGTRNQKLPPGVRMQQRQGPPVPRNRGKHSRKR